MWIFIESAGIWLYVFNVLLSLGFTLTWNQTVRRPHIFRVPGGPDRLAGLRIHCKRFSSHQLPSEFTRPVADQPNARDLILFDDYPVEFTFPEQEPSFIRLCGEKLGRRPQTIQRNCICFRRSTHASTPYHANCFPL